MARSAEPASPVPVSRASRLALGGLALLFLALSVQSIWVADVWWQLSTGRWILTHGRLPSHDPFSYTAPRQAWVAVQWLYCLLIHLAWKAGGPALLVLAQALVLAAAFLFALWPSRRVVGTVPGVALLSLGVATASTRFFVRPEILTYLFVSVFLVILDGAAGGRSRRAVWALPFLQVLWTNLHGLFVFGPLLAWVFAAREVLRRRGRRGPEAGLAPVALLVTAACWVNPYGHAGAMRPFRLYRDIQKESRLGDLIIEFRSPFAMDRWDLDLWLAAAFAVASFATFLWNRRRLDAARLAIWAGVLYLAALAVRNVGLFGFVATWASLRNLDEVFSAGESRWWHDRLGRRAEPASHALLAGLFLVAAWYVATDRFAVRTGRVQRFGLGVVEWNTPREATAFLLEAGCQPQLFHSLPDGSYLTWAAEGRFPVFIDGRLQTYGDELMNEYVNTARADWAGFARRWGINTVMIQHQRHIPVVQKIRDSGDWILVHLDHREMVFVRDIPEHAELIRRWRIEPRRPWTPRRAEPEEAPTGWRRRLGWVEAPWHSLGMAQAFLLLGDLDNAQRYLERGHRRFPDHGDTRLILAQVYRSQGRDGEAARLLAGLDLSKERARLAESLLAQLRRMQGQPAPAAGSLEQALRERPNDPALHAALGRAHLRAGDFKRAVSAYRRALELDPRPPAPWVELGYAYERLGDGDAAIDAYGQALRRDGSLYQVHNQLGDLHLRRGDPARAARHFEDALRVNPGFETARRNLERARSRSPARP